MKSAVKKIVPVVILDYLQKYKYSKRVSRFHDKSTEETFTTIYEQKIWGNNSSRSGPGSSKEMCSNVVHMINKIIDKYHIDSILDLPCGDFNWMKLVDLTNVNYLGGDIVQDLIENNIKKYSTSNINFQQINLIEDDLPQADLIIVRDCLVHFSYENILKTVENLKRSKCKYILVTTFTKPRINYDIVTGDWRPINLLKQPFNFPKPLELVEENYDKKYKTHHKGKSIALWKVEGIKLPQATAKTR